jgi:hypothetical protein
LIEDDADKSRNAPGDEQTHTEPKEKNDKHDEAKPEETKKEDPVPSSKKGVHKLAGLDCSPYGGPSNDIAQEMVYWEDIPSDSKYQSKFKKPGQYMTFESDHGGWNNVSKMVARYEVTLFGLCVSRFAQVSKLLLSLYSFVWPWKRA